MTKDELKQLIRSEVSSQLAEMIPEIVKEVVTPKLVKKMIAEAFQDVLERPVMIEQKKSNNKIAKPNIPQLSSKSNHRKLSPSDIGYGGGFSDILAETKGIHEVEASAPSVLDHAEAVPEELSEVFTRDYSKLVKAMSKK